jgi:2-dehydro-3-deoxygluconokinase
MHIACLGEGMIELSGQPLQRRFGGDTLNTAIYLARVLAGSPHQVRYLTGMGQDSLSRQLLADWQAEGVDVSHIVILPGKLPGLYMVETDARGERSFLYWRNDSAARHYFASGIDFASLLHTAQLQAVYLSGISLALFNETSANACWMPCATSPAMAAKSGSTTTSAPRCGPRHRRVPVTKPSWRWPMSPC